MKIKFGSMKFLQIYPNFITRNRSNWINANSKNYFIENLKFFILDLLQNHFSKKITSLFFCFIEKNGC